MRMGKIVSQVRPALKRALKEDCPHGDITTTACVDRFGKTEAKLVAKGNLVISGLEIFREVMRAVDVKTRVTFMAADGQEVRSGQTVARLHGKSRSILVAERTALNYLQRMSGIATLTAKFVEKVKGVRVKILDTRKTVPTMRLLDKYAVRCGGGFNHRMDLTDAPLIKENHITAAGGIAGAVRKVRRVTKKPLIVEVTNKKEVMEGLEAGVEILLLDNMTPVMVKKMAQVVNGRALIEASGGVNLKNCRAYALAGADRISVGALTSSPPTADLSLIFVR